VLRAPGAHGSVLAPLHSLGYVSPALVALAARKVYAHRVALIADPARERSVMWGSDPAAVREMMRGVRVDDVLAQVLEAVETPL
jgi:hypothetical protein